MAMELILLRSQGINSLESGLYNAFTQELEKGASLAKTGSTAVKVPSLYLGFLNIFNRRWFQRMWVIQEVAAAERVNVHCGSMIINYRCFEVVYAIMLMDSLFKKGYNLEEEVPAMCSHFSIVYTTKFGNYETNCSPNIVGGLIAANLLQATEPLDRIFALIGLPTFQGSSLPKPDYKRSLLSIFTEVYTTWQRGCSTLDMLYQLPRVQAREDWPSWVPDWTSDPMMKLYWPSDDYNAAASSSAIVEFSQNNTRELRMKGTKIDTIKLLDPDHNVIFGPPYKNAKKLSTMWIAIPRTLNLWLDKCPREEAKNTELWELVYRTMNWERLDNAPISPEALQTLRSGFGDIAYYFLNQKSAELPEFSGRSPEPLAVTENNHLASVINMAQFGDSVVILAGGAIPFILRPVLNDGEEKYTLVGPCYIDGIMNGEAYPQDENDLQWFTII